MAKSNAAQYAVMAAQAAAATANAQRQATESAERAQREAYARAEASLANIRGLTGITPPAAIEEYKKMFSTVIPGLTTKYETQLDNFKPDLTPQYETYVNRLKDLRGLSNLNDPNFMAYATGKVPGQYLKADTDSMRNLYTYNV
jgi:hypothetical protein